jgi:hypothetical protein
MNFSKFSKFAFVIALIAIISLILPEDGFAKRGGSFGGSRSSSRGSSSFGGSRGSGKSSGGFFRSKSSESKPSAFGGSRTSTPSPRTNSGVSGGSSFGGSRSMNKAQAYQKYGTPRKVENFSQRDVNTGYNRNYIINDYGGYSSGLMRGYMMGHVTGYMMWAPWHGAYWYSRPNYVYNPDGTVSVYPPTFDYTKMFITIFVFAGIVYVLYVIIRFRKRKSGEYSQSSFD